MKKLNSKLFENNGIIRNKMAKILGGDVKSTTWHNADSGGTDTEDSSTDRNRMKANGKEYRADMMYVVTYTYKIICDTTV